jgi:hypothetical protein
MSDQTVAKIILEQLGGRKFIVMTGAKNFVGSSNSLSFKLPGGGGFCNDGINYVNIELTSGDDYTVTFHRVRGMRNTLVARHEGVYFDQLQSSFTNATGLATSLGTMGAK